MFQKETSLADLVLWPQVFDKIAGYINKFKETADVVVQYDPVHAALPWAGVRLLLQMATGDTQTYGAMLDGVEVVSDVIAKTRIIERDYLNGRSAFKNQLVKAIVKLYAAVLKYLAQAHHYYSQNSGIRFAKSAVTSSQSKVGVFLDTIREEDEEVTKLMRIVQHDNTDETLNERFTDLNKTLKGMSVTNTEPKKKNFGERRLALLKWLDHVSTDSDYDNARRVRQQGTCNWILERDVYKSWLDDNAARSCILWVHGPPGFGKTVLSARVIEHLSGDLARPVAFFYCVAGNEAKRNPWAILRSWVCQMIEQKEEAVMAVEEARGDNEHEVTITKLWQLIKALCQKIPRVVFVVDGFDECSDADPQARFPSGEARSQFLRELMNLASQTRIHLLIVSRDSLDIRSGLVASAYDESKVFLQEYEIKQGDTMPDITALSTAMVQSKLSARTSDAVKRDIAEEAAHKSDGMFLWLRLLSSDISAGKNTKQLKNALSEMPAGIEAAYDRDLERAMNAGDYERERVLVMLRWMLFANRPLTVRELVEAIALSMTEPGDDYPLDHLPDSWADSDDIDEDYVNEVVKGPCGSLIEIRKFGDDTSLSNHTVHFVHFTVKEYLQKPGANRSYAMKPVSFEDPFAEHSKLATLCLRYLCFDFFNDETMLQKNPSLVYPFHYYASWNWMNHSSSSYTTTLSEDVVTLARKLYRLDRVNWMMYVNDQFGTDPAQLIPADTLMDDAIDLRLDVIRTEANKEQESNAKADASASISSTTEVQNVKETEGSDVQAAKPLEPQTTVDPQVALIDEEPTVDKIDTKLFEGFDPIYDVAFCGLTEIVDVLILDGFDQNRLCGKWGHYGCALQGAIANSKPRTAEYLMDHGASVTIKGGYYGYPFVAAAFVGHDKLVKLMLGHGVDVNVVTEAGRSALHFACAGNEMECVRMLLENGADVNLHSKTGETAVARACVDGYVEIVQLLFEKGVDPSSTSYGDWPLLVIAASFSQDSIVELLLKRGVNANVLGPGRISALNQAARWATSSTIQLLLAAGAEVDHIPDSGFTPLRSAVCRDDETVVRTLISGKASINLQTTWGFTALHSASMAGRRDFLELLFENGADASVLLKSSEDCGSMTPFISMFCPGGYMSKSGDFGGTEVFSRWMSKTNSDIHKEAGQALGWVLLWYDKSEALELIQPLLKLGAATYVDDEGDSLLFYACRSASLYRLERIRLLVDHGADLDAVSGMGVPLLHQIAYNLASDSPDIARFLLNHGAKVDMRAKHNSVTPLHVLSAKASKPYALEVARILIENGANVNCMTTDAFGSESGVPTWYPLLFVIILDSSGLDFAKLLLQSGCAIHSIAKDVISPLHYVVQVDLPDMLGLLLEHGGSKYIHGNDTDGELPLTVAARCNSVKAIPLLLRAGADMNISDSKGRFALHTAIIFKNTEAAHVLLDAGADVNMNNTDGCAPLYLAVENGLVVLAVRLIEAGAGIDCAGTGGLTPLALACKLGSIATLLLLLNAGANIHRSDSSGFWPLHHATIAGRVECIRMLLDAGANPSRNNQALWSPLLHAASRGHRTIIKLLLAAGADIQETNDIGRNSIFFAIDGKVSCMELLLEAGGDPNHKDESMHTPLFHAIWTDNNAMAEVLLKAGADVNAVDNTGQTAVYLATLRNNAEIMQKLIAAGADPNHFVPPRAPPLLEAVEKGFSKIVETLLEHKNIDINVTDSESRSALWIAISNRNGEIVKMLLDGENDIDVNAASPPKWPPLVVGAADDFVDMVELLLRRKGTDVNITNSEGDCALAQASFRGYAEIVRLLLDSGADPNLTPPDKRPPLHLAATENHVEVVNLLLANERINVDITNGGTALTQVTEEGNVEVAKLLLAAGANVNLAADSKWPPLLTAADKLFVELVRLFLVQEDIDVNVTDQESQSALYKAAMDGHVEIIEMLLKAGGDPNIQTSQLFTPLMAAAYYGFTEVVRLLVTHQGIEADLTDNLDQTSLYKAAGEGHIEVVELLLNAGANVNHQTDEKWTPLQTAVYNKRPEIVKLLLNQNDIDLNATNSEDRYALFHAITNNDTEMVKLLLDAGAEPNLAPKTIAPPLPTAGQRGVLEILDLLIDAGADPNLPCPDGNSALFLATAHSTVEAMERLLDAGADPNFHTDTIPPPLVHAHRNKWHAEIQLLLKKGARRSVIFDIDRWPVLAAPATNSENPPIEAEASDLATVPTEGISEQVESAAAATGSENQHDDAEISDEAVALAEDTSEQVEPATPVASYEDAHKDAEALDGAVTHAEVASENIEPDSPTRHSEITVEDAEALDTGATSTEYTNEQAESPSTENPPSDAEAWDSATEYIGEQVEPAGPTISSEKLYDGAEVSDTVATPIEDTTQQAEFALPTLSSNGSPYDSYAWQTEIEWNPWEDALSPGSTTTADIEIKTEETRRFSVKRKPVRSRALEPASYPLEVNKGGNG